MPRKVVEKEENIDLSQKEKKVTVVTRWFNDYAVNNKEDLKIICDLTAKSAEQQFSMYIRSGNNEIYACIFYATFIAILEFIRSKQKVKKNFTIEIANSVNIGYSNNDDEDNEKVGNFMPIMEYIGINRNLINTSSELSIDHTAESFIGWKDLNIKKTADYYKEIQESAFNKLKTDYHANLHTSEACIPLFCIFLDNITNVLKIKYQEAEGTGVSEVSMNVLGLFDVYYSYDEDAGQEIIEYQPNIMMKLTLKSDDIAAGDK